MLSLGKYFLKLEKCGQLLECHMASLASKGLINIRPYCSNINLGRMVS